VNFTRRQRECTDISPAGSKWNIFSEGIMPGAGRPVSRMIRKPGDMPEKCTCGFPRGKGKAGIYGMDKIRYPRFFSKEPGIFVLYRCKRVFSRKHGCFRFFIIIF
jgi:hypothetical protein